MFGVARTLVRIALQTTTGFSGDLDGDPDLVPFYHFRTANDERVCPICRPLHGKVFDLEETDSIQASGPRGGHTVMLGEAVHPNCRCPRNSTIKYERRGRGPQAYDRNEMFF